MTKRRGNGEGLSRLRSDGRWEYRISLPELGGKKSFYGKTRAEASKKATAARHALDMGAPLVRDERLTVARYLNDWLERKKPSIRPGTWTRYRELLSHVSRTLGAKSLAKLTPTQLERLYANLMTPPPDGRGLSSTTVHHLHTVLHQSLADAVRLGRVARNIAERRSGAKPPRMRQVEMRTFDLDQSRTFLEAARGDRLEALYALALTTGMREGELLALRWRDIDLEAGHLQVRGTLTHLPGHGYQIGQPKTKNSRRRIDLSAEPVMALRRHKVRQAEEKLASGLGVVWGDVRWPDLVFTNEIGGPIDARNLAQRSFARLLKSAHLPAIRFHDLRHTAATLMLLEGVPAKVVSERLGHSSVAFTMDRYAHVLPSMQRDAALALDTALYGPVRTVDNTSRLIDASRR